MSKFATVNLKSSSTGATVTGEFVIETPNAWQVAVDGKVRVFEKQEWSSYALAPAFTDYGNAFGGLFGGAR